MINSNFFTIFKQKIDKLDIGIIKGFLYELMDEYENFTTVFNSMNEAVIVLDIDSNITFYNKMAVKLLEIGGKNPIGFNFNEIIKNKYFTELINRAIEKEEKIDNIEIRIESNSPRYLSFSLHPFVKDGKIMGNIVILDDITADKENKHRLRQAESLAALTTISAGIAHEIKNPLAAISIHLQLIEDEMKKEQNELSKDFKYSYNVIKEEIDRLTNIVEDYLTTVRPLKAELSLVNLNSFLEKFSDFIKPELDVNNIKFIKNYKELPNVWLDEKYFKQALLNLIKNAIAAVKDNGIIKLEAYQKQNYVYINIIDSGDGILEANQSKIFDPYFTTKKYGTGLGLTIVYKIIKEHRGEITFSSKKDETTFTIKLPLSYIEDGLIEYSGDSQEE